MAFDSAYDRNHTIERVTLLKVRNDHDQAINDPVLTALSDNENANVVVGMSFKRGGRIRDLELIDQTDVADLAASNSGCPYLHVSSKPNGDWIIHEIWGVENTDSIVSSQLTSAELAALINQIYAQVPVPESTSE